MFGFRNNDVTMQSVPTTVETAWGGHVQVSSELERGDRAFITVQFTNGSKFRTNRTFKTLGDAQEGQKLLEAHLKVHDFPWKDSTGRSQWIRIDPNTFTI